MFSDSNLGVSLFLHYFCFQSCHNLSKWKFYPRVTIKILSIRTLLYHINLIKDPGDVAFYRGGGGGGGALSEL